MNEKNLKVNMKENEIWTQVLNISNEVGLSAAFRILNRAKYFLEEFKIFFPCASDLEK